MTVFILIAIIIAYFYLRKFSNTPKRSLINCGCVLLSLEAGLRHISVGPDTATYYYYFKEVANTPWASIFLGFKDLSNFRDPAFPLIEKIFYCIIPSWQMFLVAVAVLYFFSLGKALNRLISSSEGALLAFILYIALFHIIALSGLRQCIVTALSFLLIPWIVDRKWKYAIPVIILGSTIHISFLFVLLLMPFAYISHKLKRVCHFVALLLIPIIVIVARTIIFYMTSFLANDYYAGYANVERGGNPIMFVTFCSLISLYELFNYRYLNNKKGDNLLIPANILMTLSVPLIFLDGSMIRISQYFTLYMMVSLPMIFDKVSYRRNSYLSCILFFSYMICSSSMEYHFFWENVPLYYY